MRIPPPLSQNARRGYALLVVLCSMAVLLVVFASTLFWASSNAKITTRNNLFTSSQAAAESCTETVLAYMMRDFTYGSINDVTNYNAVTFSTNGWPIYFDFSDTNGNSAYSASISVGLVSTTATNLNSQFVGLFGFVQPVEIATTATPLGQGQDLSATVYQSINFALIPLFQYAIFYNMDLEINPGASMTIKGRVHSNGNLWATGNSSGSPLIFSTTVDAAGTVSNLPSPLDPQNSSRSGNVTYNDPNSPIPDYSSLTLPIGGSTNNNPTNVQAILAQPPANYAPPNYANAYSTNGMIYVANAADLIISNSATGLAGTAGTNITVYYQNPNDSLNPLTKVLPDVMISSNAASGAIYAYSFATNVTFYDYRESDTVQAVQVDVNKLNTWLTNGSARGGLTYNNKNISGSTSKGHLINSVYVYNPVPLSSSQLPAVRMINGSRLPPAGLTVATATPMYIKGDYNITATSNGFSTTLGDTSHTLPASLLADSVTILSPSWSDGYTSGTSLGSRNASSMAVNAAMLEGIVQSDGVHYSGGVENFMRLLESWSGDTLTYNGSIVVMFPSKYATTYWQTTGNYYNAPTRQWGFDTNFLSSSKLPPLTPTVKAVIRGSYATW